MAKFGLWEVEVYIRAEWKSVLIHNGLEFVEMAGIIMMLLWYAINLVMDKMVLLSDNYTIYSCCFVQLIGTS